MVSNCGRNSDKSHLSRREFVSSMITVAGGVALFSLPSSAYAAPALTLSSSSGSRKPVTSVVPLGIYAQTLMETLYPDALASLAKEVSSDEKDFADAGLSNIVSLTETGTSNAKFGKRFDPKQIAKLSPDFVLQAGIPRKDDNRETKRIEAESGASCVFLDISFGKLQESYRVLGKLLGCEQRAGELADYIDDIQQEAKSCIEGSDFRKRVFYAPRVAGKMVNAGITVQTDAMSYLGLEPIVSPYDHEAKTVNLELLAKEEPDIVLFDDTSFPEAFFSCEGSVYEFWKDIRAISEGRFAVAPALMHSILGSAVFVQSIGLLWIAYVTNPSCFKGDIAAEMVKFYSLFYGLERSEERMRQLLGIGVRDE